MDIVEIRILDISEGPHHPASRQRRQSHGLPIRYNCSLRLHLNQAVAEIRNCIAAIYRNAIHGMVTIFADGQAGLLARFRMKLGDAQSILVPGRGAIVAGYVAGGKPGEGWIELIQDKQVVRSSRPPGDPESTAGVEGWA